MTDDDTLLKNDVTVIVAIEHPVYLAYLAESTAGVFRPFSSLLAALIKCVDRILTFCLTVAGAVPAMYCIFTYCDRHSPLCPSFYLARYLSYFNGSFHDTQTRTDVHLSIRFDFTS